MVAEGGDPPRNSAGGGFEFGAGGGFGLDGSPFCVPLPVAARSPVVVPGEEAARPADAGAALMPLAAPEPWGAASRRLAVARSSAYSSPPSGKAARAKVILGRFRRGKVCLATASAIRPIAPRASIMAMCTKRTANSPGAA